MLLPAPKIFDSKAWQTCTDHSERYAMHADFLRRYKVVGMTKEQLIALLGKPDGVSDSELSWDLGCYFGADDSDIDFKMKDGKVTSVDVWGT
jgi:hypothetical protein